MRFDSFSSQNLSNTYFTDDILQRSILDIREIKRQTLGPVRNDDCESAPPVIQRRDIALHRLDVSVSTRDARATTSDQLLDRRELTVQSVNVRLVGQH